MALSAEQQILFDGIIAHATGIQDAVKRALPSNKPLHDEFRIGEPQPKTPAEAIQLARALEPVAREYRQLLVGRGVDGAKVTHLVQMAATLEKLSQSTESVAPAPEAAKSADEGTKKSKKKKG